MSAEAVNVSYRHIWFLPGLLCMQPGTRYAAKVVKIMDYGAFVELTGGTQGLLHISEIATEKVRTSPWRHAVSWSQRTAVLGNMCIARQMPHQISACASRDS